LFDASSAAIKALAADPKYVGTTQCGFFGVLHTWGRTLDYHPHVHYVVPGGGISADGTQWLPSRADFFVPVGALSVLFRAKFRAALGRAGLLSQVDPAVWRQDWVVHSKAVGDGRASLKYLAPSVFRVAISDRRIVACDDGEVTFSYRRSGSNRWRRMTVDAFEFIRRFLQHVLPSGFQKVRHFGFLSANSQVSLEMVLWLVTLHNGLIHVSRGVVPVEIDTEPLIRCTACGGPMHGLGFVRAARPTYFDTSERCRCFSMAHVAGTPLRAFEVRGRCALGARNHGLGGPACAEFPSRSGHTRRISPSNHSRPPTLTAGEPAAGSACAAPRRTVTLGKTGPASCAGLLEPGT
jgi:hypothetical protein